MLDPVAAYPVAAEYLTRESFYLDGHGEIFDVIGILQSRGIPADTIAVLDELKSRGKLDKVGGAGIILNATNSVASAAGVEHHARKIADKALLRAILRVQAQIQEACYKQEDTPDAILHQWQMALSELSESIVGTKEIQTLEELAVEVNELVAELWKRDKAVCTTGIGWLNEVSGGYQPQDLWIWAARMNVGKTRLMLYSLLTAAYSGVKVGFISMEMNKRRLMKYAGETALAIEGKYVAAAGVLRPVFLEGGVRGVGNELNMINVNGNCLVAAGLRSCSVRAIEGIVRLMSQAGCQVIFIDQTEQFTEYNPEERGTIVGIVKSLKAIAKRYNVAISLAHQINREGSDCPQLIHLADSDGPARLADFVVLLHDASRGKGDDSERQPIRPLQIYLAKSRNDYTTKKATYFDFSLGIVTEKPGGAA